MLRHMIPALTALPMFVGTLGRANEPDLKAAVETRKVNVTVTGIGGSTGDAIQVIVQRLTKEPLSTRISPGTVFRSVDGSVQDMVAAELKGERIDDKSYRARTRILLPDDQVHRYIIEALCLDFEKRSPEETSRFTLAPADHHAAKIVTQGKAKALDIRVIQAALWLDRSRVDAATLNRRFPIKESQIAEAKELLSCADSSSVEPGGETDGRAEPAPTEKGRDPALEDVLWEDVRPDVTYYVYFRDGIQYNVESDLKKLNRYEYSLDPSQSPKHYTSYFLGMVLPGIYRVEDDTACIRLGGVGGPRPTDLGGTGVRTLRRVPGEHQSRRQLEALDQVRQIQPLMLKR